MSDDPRFDPIGLFTNPEALEYHMEITKKEHGWKMQLAALARCMMQCQYKPCQWCDDLEATMKDDTGHRLINLVKLVMQWHRDETSAEYNMCDDSPCQWCVWARDAIGAFERECGTEKHQKESLVEMLKRMGYGGLCAEDCGCSIDDLCPCGHSPSECSPAHEILCGKCEQWFYSTRKDDKKCPLCN